MLKSSPDKFAEFASRFYDRVTGWAGRQSSRLKLPELSIRLTRYFSKPPALLGIESFVALSLSVYYFLLLISMTTPPEHFQNIAFFTEHSRHPFSQEDFARAYPDVKTRLPGSLLTGWLIDKLYDYSTQNPRPWTSGVWSLLPLPSIFAAYHASWLLLLFGLLIRYRADALLIILGTFSGLMLNLSITSWQYFFPWDLPSMCFFTWAILTYDNSRKIFPLMTIVWLGALFKETTLCCALLILLGEHWPVKKRIAGFVATIAAFAIAKKLLLLACAVPIQFFSPDNFFSKLQLAHNFAVTFTHPGLNHVVFVNAGTLLIVLVLPWRTYREMLFKLIAVAFATGILLFGVIIEFRVWYEILPLGWMLISEAVAKRYQPVQENPPATDPSPPAASLDDRTRRVLKGGCWLGMVLLLVFLYGMLTAAKLFPPRPVAGPKQSHNLQSKPPAQSNPASRDATNNATWTIDNPDSKETLNNLAWILATGPDAKSRNGALAVELAKRACERSHYRETIPVSTLAAAYAEAGRFDEAIATAQKACALASELGETDLLYEDQKLLVLYRAHQAFHEAPGPDQTKP